MSDVDSPTAWAIRCVQAQALRDAADAIESVWEGIEDSEQQFTPGHAARQLRARAADLEARQ